MAEAEVKQVYEILSGVETKIHNAGAYPIHKRLNFGENQKLNDVYDWITQNINTPESGKILDAGCGVGYGSFYLCQRSDCTSFGVSLSEREVAFAQNVSSDLKLEERCHFAVQSFDKPLEDKYDFIIGVESIKHSMDLSATLHNLIRSLTSTGKLVIVEDLFVDQNENRHTRHLLKDWHLKAAYTLADYQSIIEQYPKLSLKIHDLSDYVIHKSPLHLSFQYLGAQLLTSLLSVVGKGELFRIIRGGYALETLFRHQQVKYQILEISND